jgi:hypothetical protein
MSIVLQSTGGGSITLNEPATASNFTQTLPAVTGDIVVSGTTPTLNGVTFPATQVASADANTLDDYEEGTWTPTAVGQTSAGTTTYVGRTGTYTKIGNSVNATGYVEISAMTGTGDLRISLPFAINVSYNFIGSVAPYNLDWPSAGSICVFAPANNTSVRLLISVDNGAYSTVQTENSSWELTYSITYQV